ncbi:MAG TPA: DUF4349 domain-containing protein, partial [Syntrophomonadaceae bacterium]|nr:DUF4349 domain-containing protein [Syntrophomonadaceae bacterium]
MGIYASSFLPFGNMVAGLQERFDKSKQPSTASIDKILDNVKSHLAEKNASPSSPDISKPAEVASTDQEKEIPGKITKLNNPVETGPAVSAQTEATDVVNTTVKVADIGSSIQKVMGIAGENGGQYSVLAASSGVQAFSSTRTKAVSIKVDPENTDEVLTDLKDIGIAAEPQYSKTDITAQVNEVESNITSLQSQIAELENSSDKSTADNTKLDQLK